MLFNLQFLVGLRRYATTSDLVLSICLFKAYFLLGHGVPIKIIFHRCKLIEKLLHSSC